MRKYSAILLLLILGFSVSAQMKIAQIDDKDGYSNIRNGQGTDFEIVGTVEKEDFFYCEISDSSDWYQVIALKWNRGNQIKGFMHKSRIKIIENTSLFEQKKIIETTLLKHKQLAENFLESISKYDRTNNNWNSKNDSIAYLKSRSELESHSETKYDPILQILPSYFCNSNDKQTIKLFFDTMWADKGSANEMPSFSIGECFVCNSDLLIELLQQTNSKDKKTLLINQIDWGLKNVFWTEVDGENEPSSIEYETLITKLKKVK